MTLTAGTRGRREPGSPDAGFTLLELLVVIVVLGILVGIAMPSFLKHRTRAWEADAKAELATAAVTQEAYYTEHGSYAPDTAGLVGEGFLPNSQVRLDVLLADGVGYCMSAHHSAGGSTYFLSNADGVALTSTCVGAP